MDTNTYKVKLIYCNKTIIRPKVDRLNYQRYVIINFKTKTSHSEWNSLMEARKACYELNRTTKPKLKVLK